MTELAILLPLAAFVGIAVLLGIVLRRAGRIVARTRELDGFRAATADLVARIDTSLEGAASRIDAVRRGQAGPETIGATIGAATDAVDRYADEARGLNGPPIALELRDALVDELERAGRALAMVGHGADIQTRVRRRGREVEAQTSIKRGYLNLLHAREAIDRLGRQATSLDAGTDGVSPTDGIGAHEPPS